MVKSTAFKRMQWRMFILCWLAYAIAYFGRVNLSMALPELQSFLSINKAQIGILGSLFFWIYGVGQLVNGSLADRFSSRVFVFIGLFVSAVMNLFFGFSQSLTFMCIFWSVNGFAQSMLWGSVTKTVSGWAGPEKRSSAAVGISTSMVGGFILAWGVSGQILKSWTWNWVFWISGIVIMIYSFVWLFFIRSKPEGADKAVEVPLEPSRLSDSEPVIKTSIMKLFKKSGLGFIAVACLAQGMVKESISLWAPTFFMETHHLDIKGTLIFILAIPLMNLVGMLLAGGLNKVFRYREKLTAMIFFLSGLAMAAGLITLGTKHLILGVLFLGLLSACMYGSNTILLGVIPMGFAKENKVATVAGGLDFTSYLAAGFAASITGIIVEAFGWNGVLCFWGVMLIIGVTALYLGQVYQKKHQ